MTWQTNTHHPCIRILGAVDLSPASKEVVETAKRWATAFSGEAAFVHARPICDAAASRQIREQFERLAEGDGKGRRPDSKEPRILFVQGDPATEIARLAESEAFSLIILGRSGKPRADRRELGSVAEAILSQPTRPVLTMGTRSAPARAAQPRHILLTTDYSECSAAAVPVATAVARAFGATILVTHAAEPESLPGQREYEWHGAEIDALRESRREQLKRWAGERFPPGQTVDTQVVEGTPHRSICRLAARRHADLIILATRGQTDLMRSLLGGTVSRIAREAHCPVLVVPPLGGPWI